MSDFELDISKWCDDTDAKLQLFAKAFALRMTAEIRMNTPVLTGRLRSSIQPITNLSSWEPGEPIVIGTNVEYARRIEYGFVGQDSLGRHYNQPGRHMFAMAIARAPEIADEVLRDINHGGDGTGGTTPSPSGGGGGGLGSEVAQGAAIGAGAVAIGAIFGGPIGAAAGVAADVVFGGITSAALDVGLAQVGLDELGATIVEKVAGEEFGETVAGDIAGGAIGGGIAGGVEHVVMPEDDNSNE